MRDAFNIAFNIAHRRNRFQWTQKELATKVSCTSMEISHWESGRRIPSIQNLIRLADAFHLSIDELTQ